MSYLAAICTPGEIVCGYEVGYWQPLGSFSTKAEAEEAINNEQREIVCHTIVSSEARTPAAKAVFERLVKRMEVLA